jgi:streptogramin lyase
MELRRRTQGGPVNPRSGRLCPRWLACLGRLMAILSLLFTPSLAMAVHAASSGQQVAGAAPQALPPEIVLPAGWNLYNCPEEGQRVQLIGHTYVVRVYSNFSAADAAEVGLHYIPVITRINPATGNEELLGDLDELRAVALYALRDLYGPPLDLNARTFERQATYWHDFAEEHSPEEAEVGLFLVSLGQALLQVAASTIFPTGAPAAVVYLGNLLTIGTGVTEFLANQADRSGAIPGENMYARALAAINDLDASDQDALVQAFEDAGLTDVETYLQMKLYADVTEGAANLVDAADLIHAFHSGFGFVVDYQDNGVLVAKGVYHGADLANAASSLVTRIIIDEALHLEDFEEGVRLALLSNHLHAAVASRMANATAADIRAIDAAETPQELEDAINRADLRAYRFFDVVLELGRNYRYYLSEIKRHPAGWFAVAQADIDDVEAFSDEWESLYVDDARDNLERIAGDLTYTMNAGYPDYTSGSWATVVADGVTPSIGNYLDSFTFWLGYQSQDPNPPAGVVVVIGANQYPLAPAGSQTYDGQVYYHDLEVQRSGFPVDTYRFHFEVPGLPPTAEKSFVVHSDPTTFDPSISIVSPRAGTQVSDPVEIQAWTLTGNVQNVRFFANNILLCDDQEQPWTCIWNTESPLFDNGEFELLAVATDDEGQQVSDQIRVILHKPEHNEPPDIEVLAPSGETAYGRFSIRWDDEDLDDNATVSLWYDTNSSGYDGVLIQDYLKEDWTSDWWSWDISDLPGGASYWVYARIDDGTNPPVFDYSDGPLTIAILTAGANFDVVETELVEDAGSDGDGVPDAGETLEFEITIRNSSAQEQCFVEGILSATAPGVTILDNRVNYYSPDAGATSGGRGTFDFVTEPTFDGTIDFELSLTYEDCTTGAPFVETESVPIDIHPNDTTPPLIVAGPTVSNIQPDSALISWTTDEPSDSVVEYGLTTAYGSVAQESGCTTDHQVMIRGLVGGHEHFFRVRSTDPSGNGPTQATGSLTTTNLGAGFHVDQVIYPDFEDIHALAWDGSHLWVLEHVGFDAYTVHRYDPSTDLVLSSFDLNFLPGEHQSYDGLAWDGSHLWVADRTAEVIYRVTTAGSVVSQFDTFIDQPVGLAWGDGSLWVGDEETLKIYRLTSSGSLVGQFNAPGLGLRDLAWSRGHLWVADTVSDSLYEMDGAGSVLDIAPVPEGVNPKGFAAESDSFLWLAEPGDDGRLMRIEIVEDTTSPLIISGPTASGAGTANTMITWDTDEPADSRVEYGLTTAYGQSKALSTDTYHHAVPIEGLSPATTYHYRVGSQDMPGNEVTWSADHTFTTGSSTVYNVRTSFRRSVTWRMEGITWNGTHLVGYEGLKEHYYTLDIENGDILDHVVYTLRSTSPWDLVWVGGDIWFAESSGDDSLIRFDGHTGAEEQRIVLDSNHNIPRGIAWDGSYLRVADRDSENILRINPSTGAIVSSFPYPEGINPGALDYHDGYLWLVDNTTGGVIYKLTTSGTVVETITPPTQDVWGIAWDGNYMWITDDQAEYVYQLDPAPTSAPVLARVYSESDVGELEHYPVGSTVDIIACEQYGRVGLTATLTITSTGGATLVSDAAMSDRGDGCYDYAWNTAGSLSTEVYGVEVRLTDGTYTDGDGLWRTPDLEIQLAHFVLFSDTVTVNKMDNQALGLAWAGNSLWVNGYSRVDRYDEGDGVSDAYFLVPVDPLSAKASEGMDWDGNYLWVAHNWTLNGATPAVSRYDYNGSPYGGYIYGNSNFAINAIALTSSGFWLADDEVQQICRYGWSGGTASFCFHAPPRKMMGIEWDGTYLWGIDTLNRLYKYDAAGNLVDRFIIPSAGRGLSFKGEELWTYTGMAGDLDEYLQFRNMRWLPDLAPAPLQASQTVVQQGQPVVITATIYADNGEAQDVVARFYLGDPASGGVPLDSDHYLGTVSPGSPAETTISWSTMTPGLYRIYLQVDPDGAIEENQENNNVESIKLVVYDPDPDPPVISAVTVTEETGDLDGVLEDNEVLRFTWVVTDAISGVGSTSVTVDGTAYPGQDSYHALVGPLAEGVYPFTIHASDHSDESATYEAEIEVANHALQVTDAFPPTGSGGIHTSDLVGAQFATVVQAQTLSTGTFSLLSSGGVTVTGEVGYDSTIRQATFVPQDELENGTSYEATLVGGPVGALDEYSNTLDMDYTWSFATVPDVTPLWLGPRQEPGCLHHRIWCGRGARHLDAARPLLLARSRHLSRLVEHYRRVGRTPHSPIGGE